MNRKNLFFVLIAVAVILLGFNLNKTESAITTTIKKISIPAFKYDGRMSHFGGPGDIGQKALSEKGNLSEGLAYYNFKNISSAPTGLFLSNNDPRIMSLNNQASKLGTTLGLARYLNPDSYYVAMRLPPGTKPGPVVITANGKSIVVQVVDWGPSETTKRDVDLSPGAEKALGLQTDQKVDSVVWTPEQNLKLGPYKGNFTPEELNQQQKTNNPCAGGGGGVGCGGSKEIDNILTLKNNVTSNSGGNIGSGGMLWNETDRLCHKHQGSATTKQLKTAMSCNGGFKCTTISCGEDCVYCNCAPVEKCGTGGILCNSPKSEDVMGYGYCEDGRLETAKEVCKGDSSKCGPKAGCLNYICPIGTKDNAIWDMQSKKCGCG